MQNFAFEIMESFAFKNITRTQEADKIYAPDLLTENLKTRRLYGYLLWDQPPGFNIQNKTALQEF